MSERIVDILERLATAVEALASPTYDLGINFARWTGVPRIEDATGGTNQGASRWRAFQWRLGTIAKPEGGPKDNSSVTYYQADLTLVVGYPPDPKMKLTDGTTVDVEKVQGSDFALYDRLISRAYPFSNATYGDPLTYVQNVQLQSSTWVGRVRSTIYRLVYAEAA